MSNCAEREASWLRNAEGFFLLLFAIAWPWELYQQLPGGLTLAKVAGAGILVTAGISILRAPRGRLFRTGLEGPMILLAVACLQSLLHSADPGLSRGLAFQYALYGLLFYAVTRLVQRREEAVYILLAFAYSSAMVAALALVCAAGWAAPALAETTRDTGRYLPSGMRAGAQLRMAAASPDFNQGVLPFLLSLPLVLLVPGKDPWRRAAQGLAVLVLIAGIVVSFSRSSLLVAGLLLAGGLLAGIWRRQNTWKLLLAAAGLVAVAVLVGHGYVEALFDRFARGISSEDASYRTRWYVISVGWSLLPQHGLWGTGLGASDVAIAAAADPAKYEGFTLHSVPMKLWLEIGILGLVGYLWAWWAIFRRGWAYLRVGDRAFGQAVLGLSAACFAIFLVQPFMALSVAPLLAGLIFGPRAGAMAAEASAGKATLRWRPAAAALAVVSIVVVPNFVAYQKVCGQVSAFADTLAPGPEFERSGDWEEAASVYTRAHAIATAPGGFQGRRYAPAALGVVDLLHICRQMGLGEAPRAPAALSAYGMGRAHYGRGNFAAASEAFRESIDVSPGFAEAYFGLGESLWAAGRFAEALDAYSAAREVEGRPENAAFAARMADYGAHDGVLGRHALRRLGRWTEAVALASARADQGTATADDHYVLGVASEIDGDERAALRAYERALVLLPNHAAANARFAAFSKARGIPDLRAGPSRRR